MLNEQIDEIKAKLKDNPNSKKNKNKYQELNKQLTSNQKHITKTENLIKSDGDVLHLASAYYIWNKDEVYYLSSDLTLNITNLWGISITMGYDKVCIK